MHYYKEQIYTIEVFKLLVTLCVVDELIYIDEKIDQAGILTVESIDLKKFLKNTSLTTKIVRG
jgi:hypothetical protein